MAMRGPGPQGAAMEERRRKALEELCAFDDVLFRCMIRDNIPFAQFLLRILMRNPHLRVKRLETQMDLKNISGSRSICLDVYLASGTGAVHDLEVEGRLSRANPHRARYHASALDVEHLKPGQDFRELPESWTIFLTDGDFFGLGRAFYRVERMVLEEDAEQSSEGFRDGSHILYVNGAYRETSGQYGDIGRLMHDFHETDPGQMYFPEMAETARQWKESEGGKQVMSSIMQELIDEAVEEAVSVAVEEAVSVAVKEAVSVTADETAIRIAAALLKRGFPPEDVAEGTGLSPEKVKALTEMIDAG